MFKRLMSRCALAALSLGIAGGALAQGTQAGVLSGQVQSSDGQPLPGVTITAQSPALQGLRTAVSDSNGGYIIKALPPGAYTVTFELTGMSTVRKSLTVALGASAQADASLSVAAVEETVTVTAEAPSALEQSTVGANYGYKAVDQLATGRTLAAIAELAPGLSDNTPNADQVTISGSFAFDNVFLVNGVDVNDNLFGSPNSLFIEDAFEEVQVLTSGISAEYGRFSGGVINAVTKRGGNAFSGSFRVDYTNPAWRDENPLERCEAPGQNPATCVPVDRSVDRTGQEQPTNKTYTATLGGPILKDRLWFFGSARSQDLQVGQLLQFSAIPYTQQQTDDRYQAQLTGTLAQNHTLQASYIDTEVEQFGPSLAGFAADPATFYIPSRTTPQSLFAANYNGVISPSLFAEVQYSQKKFKFENTGGQSTAFVDSPIFTNDGTHYYNAPYFASKDPEDRDNRQITGSLSYFLSTSSLGRHDLKAGYENYRSTNTGGNSQSQTDYTLYADYVGEGTVSGPALDAQGRFQPIFEPGANLAIRWYSTPGARIDITTQSFFLNDKWQIDSHWSANLGLRYERVRSDATGGIIGVDTDNLVPRLALGWDAKGDGKVRLDATYAQYAGKFAETQFANNTTVGNPAYLYLLYTGPAGVGRGCAGCFDPANYTEVLGGGFPTATKSFAPNLSSPTTREWTFSAGVALPRGGYVKAVYSDRAVSNFFENFVDQSTGQTDVSVDGVDLGAFDRTLYANTDDLVREYRAVQLQASYRLTDAWTVQGHWTHQLRNYGNYEGEGTNTPGATSNFGDYPEIFNQARHYPLGRLNDYQADKLRLWTNYDLGLGRAGRLNLGLLFRYDSPLTGSNVANNQGFSSVQRQGFVYYATGPAVPANDVFFGERGTVEFDAQTDVDLALNYEVPLFKSLRPYVKLDVRNVFNNQAQILGNTAVAQDPNSPVDELGLRTGFRTGATYLAPRNNADYQLPRELRLSLGFRF